MKRHGAALAAVLLACVACASGGTPTGGSGGDTDPITVGLITSETGNLNFVTGRYGLELYVDKINESGGVGGRKIRVVTAEGSTDPTLTASAARKLVDQEKVDVMVASQAVADCPVNGAYYTSRKVAVISPSYDPSCFTTDGIFPYIADGRYYMEPGLKWAQDQGARTVGFLGLDSPANQALAGNLQKMVESRSGTWAGAAFVPVAGGGDVVGPVLRFQQARVDTVLTALDPGYLGAALAAAEAQGIGLPQKVRWVQATGGYGSAQAAALGSKGDGLYVVVNNEPFENATGGTAELVEAMKRAHPDVPPDGFASIGWAGGAVLQSVLQHVSGTADRGSLLAAVRATPDARTGTNPAVIDFTRTPVDVAVYGRMVLLEGGRWTVASDWIRSDAAAP